MLQNVSSGYVALSESDHKYWYGYTDKYRDNYIFIKTKFAVLHKILLALWFLL